MVDFYEEPEKDCPKDPIGELDLKIEQYYSSIYSKLFNHTSDTTVHITQEERDVWNNKASKEALKDIQDQLNSMTGDSDDSLKNKISTELKEYVSTIITGLDINSYAKTEEVAKLIAGIDLSDYAEKEWCNNTFAKAGSSSGASLDNYYTKSDVDKLINDYSIKTMAFRDNALTLIQNGTGGQAKTFTTEISAGDSGISEDYLATKLIAYLKKDGLHNIILDGHTLNLASQDIIINTSGSSAIDGQDGATYTPYFQNNNSWSNPPALPDDYKSPAMSSTVEGKKWSTQATTAATGEYTWITYVTIDANGAFGKWLNPVCLTGHTDGDVQGLVGSPLRNKGEWNSSTTYYDGHTTQVGDAFWQDFVSHTVNGIANYYVCVKQNSGKEPGASGSDDYWSLLSYTDDMFVNNLVAKKANIGELSANEILITDSSDIVKAGMTSGKSTSVSGQGDVRIWAGSNGSGNIAAAPFTVTESGVLNAKTATLDNVTFTNTYGNTYITSESRKIQIGGQIQSISTSGLFVENEDGVRTVEIGYIRGIQSTYEDCIMQLTDTKNSRGVTVSPVSIALTKGGNVRFAIYTNSDYTKFRSSGNLVCDFDGGSVIKFSSSSINAYDYIIDAYNDSSLEEGSMYFLKDTTTKDSSGNYYKDYTLHVKGSKIE